MLISQSVRVFAARPRPHTRQCVPGPEPPKHKAHFAQRLSRYDASASVRPKVGVSCTRQCENLVKAPGFVVEDLQAFRRLCVKSKTKTSIAKFVEDGEERREEWGRQSALSLAGMREEAPSNL